MSANSFDAQDFFNSPQMVQLPGVKLAVYSAGEGRPIVLCHGWPEIAFSWRYQVPALVDAGYHVILPDMRGFGASEVPDSVAAYDANHITEDLTALIRHFGYDSAVFVGHDWGAINVWNLAELAPERVDAIINMSVPHLDRGPKPWVDFWDEMLGDDLYIVHFNKHPGVADAAFEAGTENLLRALYRSGQWLEEPRTLPPGMPMLHMAEGADVGGQLIMSEAELAVFVNAYKTSGFTGGLNYYRNFNSNWHLLKDKPLPITIETLLLQGRFDMVPADDSVSNRVSNLTYHMLDCGHWIQQELPEQTNQLMLEWLAEHAPAA